MGHSQSPKRKSRTDPDITALLEETTEFTDARSAVIHLARQLNARYRLFDCPNGSALDRLKVMASLQGFNISPMNLENNPAEKREALILLNGLDGRAKGQILYNPDRADGRIAFSIAHEITHTFFPTTSGGVRYRSDLDGNNEASELEALCNLGAAELLMPLEDFTHEVAGKWSLESAERLAQRFGSSIEATVFRLATASRDNAIAGSLVFRRTKADERKLMVLRHNIENRLFPDEPNLYEDMIAAPKYRRQSLFTSQSCDSRSFIPWNKSFSESSIAYIARPITEKVTCAYEALPNKEPSAGHFEVIVAPYQPEHTNPNYPNVLFFWKS